MHYQLCYASMLLATKTRLELVTSSVTGWHSNQLNYLALCLSSELLSCLVSIPQVSCIIGGRYRARTYDLLLVRQMLSQLS